MTPDEIIKVVQAYKYGKKIQFRGHLSKRRWLDIDDPSWDFQQLEYRVKPEPRVKYVVEYRNTCVSLQGTAPLLGRDAYDSEAHALDDWKGSEYFIRVVKFVEEINNDE